MDDLEVKLFRAITGKGGKDGIFEGVSDQELFERGIFNSNFSSDQYRPIENLVLDIRVPGLPVFLNFEEVMIHLDKKQYKSMPAIVEASLPIGHFFGEGHMIELARNYGYMDSHTIPFSEALGYKPTREQIERHLSGEKVIRGEAYINHLVDPDLLLGIVLPHQRFYRPNQMVNGYVKIEEGFHLVKLQ